VGRPVPAAGANSEILQPVSGDLESRQLDRLGRCLVRILREDILDPAAFGAPHVVVLFHVAVEPGFGAGKFHLVDHTVLVQDFQVTVDCTQTDAGQPPTDNRVEFCSGRMRLQVTKLFQDHPALGCISAKLSECHDASPSRIGGRNGVFHSQGLIHGGKLVGTIPDVNPRGIDFQNPQIPFKPLGRVGRLNKEAIDRIRHQ
jgi:hypothetical protein